MLLIIATYTIRKEWDYKRVMLVSIIVPVYNVEKFIGCCIESLINQTYKDIEIILVDDGSTDSSGRICDYYALNDKRITVIHQPNGGPSEARKSGVNRASGEYLMIVDGDDWIDINTIKICTCSLKENADAECVMFSYVREYPDHTLVAHIMSESAVLIGTDVENRVYRRLYGLVGDELKHPERLESMGSCCMKLYKRQVAQKGKFYDVRDVGSSEDILFNMYALCDCNKIVYIDEPMYHYRKTGRSITSTYRPHLIEQWKYLFKIMRCIIEEKSLGDSYCRALDSRVSLSILGIGMNEISGKNVSAKQRIQAYINEEFYCEAIKNVNIGLLPLPWKCLLWFAKMKFSMLVYLELWLISRVKKKL